MDEQQTTKVVQNYLEALAGDEPAEPIIRALLDRAVGRRRSCARACFIAATRV